tara:strand:- start:484 stop:741 length:258 start_codon:yes stop_codon:yes gene_type:complete
MSNMSGITKGQFPEGTTASLEGFIGANGEILLNADFTQAEVDEWNGTSSDLPETGDTTTSSASPEAPKVKAKAKKPAKKKKWFKK